MTNIRTGTLKAPGDIAFPVTLTNAPITESVEWAVDYAAAQAQVDELNAFVVENWTLPEWHPVKPIQVTLLPALSD